MSNNSDKVTTTKLSDEESIEKIISKYPIKKTKAKYRNIRYTTFIDVRIANLLESMSIATGCQIHECLARIILKEAKELIKSNILDIRKTAAEVLLTDYEDGNVI